MTDFFPLISSLVMTPFQQDFRCYSMALKKGRDSRAEELNQGGKIILPQTALEKLSRLSISYPMLFQLTNPLTGQVSHTGVIEFTAEEGRVYMPYWMMENIGLVEGSLVNLKSITLNRCRFAKFQPQSTDFLDISNPKAVLENVLRHFACLTEGDIVALHYNNKIYQLAVLELKPSNAVSIIECDMQVDFAPPVGYIEPDYKSQRANSVNSASSSFGEGHAFPSVTAHLQAEQDGTAPMETNESRFQTFAGSGYRLDGKVSRKSPAKIETSPIPFSGQSTVASSYSSSAAMNIPSRAGSSLTSGTHYPNASPSSLGTSPSSSWTKGKLTFVRAANLPRASDDQLNPPPSSSSEIAGEKQSQTQVPFNAFAGKGQSLK